MAAACFNVLNVPFEQTTELERQVIAAFVFGMQHAAGMVAGADAQALHAATVHYLQRDFRYSPEQAIAFAEDLVTSASGVGNPVINAIIHRGIDGHLQWSTADHAGLSRNITDVLVRVCAPAPQH